MGPEPGDIGDSRTAVLTASAAPTRLAGLGRRGHPPDRRRRGGRRRTDTTLFVFASDNGYTHGEHRRVPEDVIYEPSIKVPLFVAPGFPGGAVVRTPVMFPDLAPAFLRLAGARRPDHGRHGAATWVAAQRRPGRAHRQRDRHDGGGAVPGSGRAAGCTPSTRRRTSARALRTCRPTPASSSTGPDHLRTPRSSPSEPVPLAAGLRRGRAIGLCPLLWPDRGRRNHRTAQRRSVLSLCGQGGRRTPGWRPR